MPADPGESSPVAGERGAYGVLVAALEEGLVRTLEHATEVLRRFSAPTGLLGEDWLKAQEKRFETGHHDDAPGPVVD